MALRRLGGGSDWSLRFPSSPRTIHGMRSGPSGSLKTSGWGSGSGLGLGLGLDLGGAKEMLKLMEEEKEHVRRGRVRKDAKDSVWDLEKQ
ncbi:hypothetical protein VIGAN_08111500 [Vigna angularis var. angularis]|uniref:Uncharacterized protein n=1 Tax=Vigna angularis var. angularis TaxID=157739 RepID=A0A0S3SNX1_PHAAN|nr:hypothetical protein VIGAN_08111500 [Vigna angularis var. angularis]